MTKTRNEYSSLILLAKMATMNCYYRPAILRHLMHLIHICCHFILLSQSETFDQPWKVVIDGKMLNGRICLLRFVLALLENAITASKVNMSKLCATYEPHLLQLRVFSNSLWPHFNTSFICDGQSQAKNK